MREIAEQKRRDAESKHINIETINAGIAHQAGARGKIAKCDDAENGQHEGEGDFHGSFRLCGRDLMTVATPRVKRNACSPVVKTGKPLKTGGTRITRPGLAQTLGSGRTAAALTQSQYQQFIAALIGRR